MASKGLDSLSGTDIPELSESIASTRDEGVLVGRVQANAHDIAKVIGELGDPLAGLDIPANTGHVTRRGEDTAVIDEATAGEVSSVTRELAGDARGAFSLLVEVINRANVVETTAGDEVAAGGIGAGHDP